MRARWFALVGVAGVSFLMGRAIGAAIWLLSPLITGGRESWDAEGGYYMGVLTDSSSGGLWPLGVMFLALYSLLTLLGAALGRTVQGLRRRRTL